MVYIMYVEPLFIIRAVAAPVVNRYWTKMKEKTQVGRGQQWEKKETEKIEKASCTEHCISL